MSGKVAMVVQGAWMSPGIRVLAPSMEWGAAPMPVKDTAWYGITYVGAELVIIPKGAPHVREAMVFPKWMFRPENLEIACRGHEKFSPLSHTTDSFYIGHGNPYIRMFKEMAESPLATSEPRNGTCMAFRREMAGVQSRIWLNLEDPKSVLNEVTAQQQRLLDKHLAVLRKAGKISF